MLFDLCKALFSAAMLVTDVLAAAPLLWTEPCRACGVLLQLDPFYEAVALVSPIDLPAPAVVVYAEEWPVAP